MHQISIHKQSLFAITVNYITDRSKQTNKELKLHDNGIVNVP